MKPQALRRLQLATAQHASHGQAVGELEDWLRLQRRNPGEDVRPFAQVLLQSIRASDRCERAQAEARRTPLGSPRHVRAALEAARLSEECQALFHLALTGQLDADDCVVPFDPNR